MIVKNFFNYPFISYFFIKPHKNIFFQYYLLLYDILDFSVTSANFFSASETKITETIIKILPAKWYQAKNSLNTNMPTIKLVIGSKVLKIEEVVAVIYFR